MAEAVLVGWGRLAWKNPADRLLLPALDFRVRVLLQMLLLYAGPATIRVSDVATPGAHGEGSPHYELRAVDVSLAPLGLAALEAFAEWVNEWLDFGAGYRVALVGRTDPKGKHADHLHLQVPRPHRATGVVEFWRAADSLAA